MAHNVLKFYQYVWACSNFHNHSEGNMKKINVFLISTCLVLQTLPAFSGTMATETECINGCPTGSSHCVDYCLDLFEPCFDNCAEENRRFISKCARQGKSYEECYRQKPIENKRCKNNCHNTIKKDVDFPNWMGEQECPYDCQTWNPAGRLCVGAKRNGCGG